MIQRRRKKVQTDLAHEFYVGYGWTAAFLRKMLSESDSPIKFPLLEPEDYTAMWASIRYREKLNKETKVSFFATDIKDDWLTLENVPSKFGTTGNK